MQIHYINDGSHDSPVIRLLTDQKEEIEMLQSCITKLGTNESGEETINSLPISQSRLQLVFKVDKSDYGISVSKDQKEIFVAVSCGKWLEISTQLEPFLLQQSGFVWLFESPKNSLLFTTDGYW